MITTSFSSANENGYSDWMNELLGYRNSLSVMEVMLNETSEKKIPADALRRIKIFRDNLTVQYEEIVGLEESIAEHGKLSSSKEFSSFNMLQNESDNFISDGKRFLYCREIFFDLRKKVFEFLAYVVGAPAKRRENFNIF